MGFGPTEDRNYGTAHGIIEMSHQIRGSLAHMPPRPCHQGDLRLLKLPYYLCSEDEKSLKWRNDQLLVF